MMARCLISLSQAVQPRVVLLAEQDVADLLADAGQPSPSRVSFDSSRKM